jgi:2-dehydropantoate 2-reductase
VIFGAGAIGGVVGARLHQAGHPVTLIARGPHLEAIRRDGLTLATPSERVTLAVDACADPAAVRWAADDVVLLAVKGQDTLDAVIALRAAAGDQVPVVCVQNGVENERLALRFFDRVYGAVVMAPTGHLEPGVVEAYGSELSGMIDLGRFPRGTDPLCEAVAAALDASRFRSRAVPDIMRLKYAKLLLNLGNAAQALCGPEGDTGELTTRAVAEGHEVLQAAGIDSDDDGVSDISGRHTEIGISEIAGRARPGGSTWQSLQRGAGAIETDYLNGEIVLLGRLHGIPTPVNGALCRVAARVAREGGAPGSVSPQEILGAIR